MSNQKHETGADSRSMGDPIFPVTRWVTGGSYITAYVWKGKHGVLGCKHKHRTTSAARRCAERMTRRFKRESSAGTELKP